MPSRMAVSASRSAAVTGSNRSPPLWSILCSVRKCGKMTAPALSASAWAVARRAWNSSFLGSGTGTALRQFCLASQGFQGSWTRQGKIGRRPRDRYASVFRKCLGNVTGTLLFVRRNDILLQRGMALQAIPLPSLGVSSLDLGRSFNRAALFLFADGYSAAARGTASPEMAAASTRTMASRSPSRRSKPADFSKLVSSI